MQDRAAVAARHNIDISRLLELRGVTGHALTSMDDRTITMRFVTVLLIGVWSVNIAFAVPDLPPMSTQFTTGGGRKPTCSLSASKLVLMERERKAKLGWFKGTFLPALGIRPANNVPAISYTCSEILQKEGALPSIHDPVEAKAP